MPLLGAIGNASEYSFRGTYDNYPFDIDFGDLIDAEPGQIYTTILKLVEDINYKVPISITGDGEYYIGNVTFDKTFDNNYITFDQTATTFDATFPELDYSTQPTYARNGNIIGLRIFSVPPITLSDTLTIVPRGAVLFYEYYNINLNNQIEIDLRSSSNYTFDPNGSVQIDGRTFQGSEIGTEYYDKTYSTTITIGKRDFTWTVKTKAAESAQNLSFTNQSDVEYSTEIISNTYTAQGLTDTFDYTADITSNEGLLSVNYGEFVTSSPIKNGDILRLELISSSLNAFTKTATVRIALTQNPTVGAASTNWTITTLDSVPSNLRFNAVAGAELNAQILSEIIKIEGLSGGIDFDISISSTDGLLSVNNGTFVKSATIKNNDQLQLSANTSSVWLEEKNVVVQLANISTFWKIVNRNIEAKSDINADKLIYAIPFNEINEIKITDFSPNVREKSLLPAGEQASPFIDGYYDNTYEYYPSISGEKSKYYGDLGSLKLAKGITTKSLETSYIQIITYENLGYSDFTIELWMWFSGFGFGGESGMSIFYPPYIENKNINDYFFQLYLKGDNWPNQFNYKRGILLGYPDSNGVVQTLCETTSQVLTTYSWNHIAITRSGSTFKIWVNGILRASASRYLNLTEKIYNFAVPKNQKLIQDDVYIQDLRLYKGIAKYTDNFNISNIESIMD